MNEISSLYIHFPFCIKKCNYCDFHSGSMTDQLLAEYEENLTDNLKQVKDLLKKENFNIAPLKTIYIGGGTPSLWGKRGAHFLKNFFKNHNLYFDKEIEFTIEINPKSDILDSIDCFKDIGVNRFSIGLQSTDDYYLNILERVHTKKEIFPILKFLKNSHENYSVDFIIGLPGSKNNKREITTELNEVLQFNPKHISVYILDVPTNYKHFNDLPNEEYIELEYLKVSNHLRENGFIHYEVSNFSKKGYPSRHNMAYWKSKPVIALGPSATGFLPKENSALRYKINTSGKNFEIENLSHKQLKLEELYMSFRTNQGIDLEYFFSKPEIEKLLPFIENWIRSNLATKNKQHIQATPKGYLVLDSMMDDIFKIST